MSDGTSILILTSCTATKSSLGRRPVLAEDLYAGQQHRRLMRGVTVYRDAGQPAGPLELQILSAGRGVVPGDRRLVSYDATFFGMRREQLQRRARKLGVPRTVGQLLAAPRQLAVLLLGDSYLQAAEITEKTELGAPTLAFTSPGSARRLPSLPGLLVVPLDNAYAKRFSCGLVSLKGELAARLLARLALSPTAPTPRESAALLEWLAQPLEGRTINPALAAA